MGHYKCFSIFLMIALLTKTQNVQAKVNLRSYQKYPTDYLLANPEQKGLLIYHGLGTGKTFLSLNYTEKFPQKEVIVILPRHLKSNWKIHINRYQVKKLSRYRFVSLKEAPIILANYDFKKSIVIIDEAHKLVDLVQSSAKENAPYSQLYLSLRKAYKILALTGTPIFSELTDIAYLANLVSGKDLLTIEVPKFNHQYTRIKPFTSLFRGYFTESKLVLIAFPLLFSFGFASWAAAWGLSKLGFLTMAGTFMLPFVVNETNPTDKVAFREFKASALKSFTEKYISFYEVKEEKHLYPKPTLINHQIEYTEAQSRMFLDFADESMNTDALKALLVDEKYRLNDKYIQLHKFNIQKVLLSKKESGREIGNIPIYIPRDPKKINDGIYYPYRTDRSNMIYSKKILIEPSKFEEIYKIIKEKPGKVVIYSNYFKNGVLQFVDFLKRKGMINSHLILTPDDSVTQQVNIINLYNSGKKRILLLHPDITEGVSLEGTEQLHILEPIKNIALLEQVIGRVIRLNSHASLPKARRKVDVHLWESSVSYCSIFILTCLKPTKAGLIRREQWQKRYSEINPSSWTFGITNIDKNFHMKNEAPDIRIERNSLILAKNIANFKVLSKEYSIENDRKKVNNLALVQKHQKNKT